MAASSSCGDDNDDNDSTTTDAGSDAATNDAGDAQVVADAGDAAIDAGTPATDAGSDAGDAGSDAGAPDSGSELAQALVTTGVRTDRRRAELLAPPFCTLTIGCAAMSPPTQGACEASLMSDYDDLVEAGDTPNCIDAHLDFAACVATGGTCQEVITRCATIGAERDSRCD